ncbi:MAG: hypothetical protein R6W84_09205 [Promethearchaeia archaeon]
MHLSDNDKKRFHKIITKLKQDEDILAAILYGSALKSDSGL